jgi:uncharacterized lipoprotein YddW (UPF0748 family)
MDCFTSQEPEYAYVSPGIAGVRAQLAAVAADIVRRYAVDGIHLDRIRYPGSQWSWDEPSLTAFRARFGRQPASAADPDWQHFRQEQVDAAVKGVFDAITAVRPGIVLSAAVWPIYDRRAFGWPSSSGLQDFSQDTRAWAAGGYLDVAVPMAYFRINDEYCSYRLPRGRTNPDWACLLDEWKRALRPLKAQLYMGLYAELGPAEVARQVQLGREKGVQGFAVYSYASAEQAGLFTALPATVFRARAAVPPAPRP